MAEGEATNNDAAWLRSVIQQHETHLLQYSARLLGDVERARDVTQDTFLELCRQPRSRVERHVRQWLFTVCRNRATDVLRKEQRMRTLDEQKSEQLADHGGDPQVVSERREMAGQAVAILETLPANQREVIRLKIQHALSYREISEVTGLSISNVGFLLHTGINTIRTRLAQGVQRG